MGSMAVSLANKNKKGYSNIGNILLIYPYQKTYEIGKYTSKERDQMDRFLGPKERIQKNGV